MSPGDTLPTVDFDPGFWLDVEVPADIIQDNWDDEYEDQLIEYADSQRMVGAELAVYWRLGTDLDPPREKTQIVRSIIGRDPEWGMNLRSAYWFTSGKNADYASYFFEQLEPAVRGTELDDLYDDFDTNGRKFGQVLLLDLFEPARLKSILALDFIQGKKPYSISRSEVVPDTPLDEINVDAILDQLRSDSRQYRAWHEFTYNGNDYLVIKRHLRDEVERQVDENQPLETAEFVVAKFRDELLEVYSERRDIANRTRTGVNTSFPDGSDIEYEPIDETASYDHFDDIDGQIRNVDTGDTFSVIGIKSENAPLAGSPTIELKSSDGIMDALDELAQRDIDLLDDPDNINSIQIRYGDRSFDLYPERKEASDGEMRWRLRYDSRFPSDEERDEFEAAVEDELGVRPVFERS